LDVVINIAYFTQGQGYGFLCSSWFSLRGGKCCFVFFTGAGTVGGEQRINPIKGE